jgi:hypothetical protein
LTLPNTGSELKVAIWASGTPEQFLLANNLVLRPRKPMP